MNKFKIALILISILLLCLFFSYWLINGREYRLTYKSNNIIKQIEQFKNDNNRLPYSLDEIEIKNNEGADEIYYDIRPDSSYMISFMMSIDQNKFYYSDIGQWENSYR
ncbi:MAG: hypothetical protein LBM25_06010 [Bacteroidales bacterium]|jgi:hypothetical protein|nr:hypothetical protein [Bacteroidales bacterium]